MNQTNYFSALNPSNNETLGGKFKNATSIEIDTNVQMAATAITE